VATQSRTRQNSDSKQRAKKNSDSRHQKATYVYGIMPADIKLTSEMKGVGDPPGKIRVVRQDDLAALVSDVDVAGSLGSPEDLTAHKEILDACAADLPVLPMRFGAVLTDDDAVADELLAEHHDEFAAALDELDGRAEFVIKGRYDERAILEEVLSENQQAAELREQIRGQDADATRDARIALGEIINEAITAKREQDTRTLGDKMDGHAAASVVREPGHERESVNVGFLLDPGQQKHLQRVLDELAKTWKGRVELRVLGPMAAYDFVVTAEPQG
jgi:Gas vesicle synthesis protein GvpL/GvpF